MTSRQQTPIDTALDRLLAEGLAPPDRAPDRSFVARVDAEVAEHDRFRRVRTRMVAELARDGLCMAAIAAPLALLARSPALEGGTSVLIWPVALILFLLWRELITGRTRILS